MHVATAAELRSNTKLQNVRVLARSFFFISNIYLPLMLQRAHVVEMAIATHTYTHAQRKRFTVGIAAMEPIAGMQFHHGRGCDQHDGGVSHTWWLLHFL